MAFTQLYLHNAAAPYSPATFRGAWDDTAGSVTQALYPYKLEGGTITNVARAETNVSPTWDVLLYRGVSGTLAAQTISGTLDLMVGVAESNVAADMYYHVHVYVTQGDSDTPRGTLLTDYVENTTNEFPVGTLGAALQSAQSLSSLAISAGDRLVVEIGYIARNSSGTSRTGAVRYGTYLANGHIMTDLTVGQNGDTGAGYLLFSNAIEEVPSTSRVSQAAVEVASGGLNTTRVSQLVVEVASSGSSTVGTTRASQYVVEIAAASAPPVANTRVSQFTVETAAASDPPSFIGDLRVTQEPIEAAILDATTAVRLTQLMVEPMVLSGSTAIRLTQCVIEAFYPFSCGNPNVVVPPPDEGCPEPLPTDAGSDDAGCPDPVVTSSGVADDGCARPI